MKKITAALLVLSLLLCLSVSSFAANSETVIENDKAVNIIANGKYEPVERPENVISVDIQWGNMDFVYFQGEKTWNSANHSYTSAAGHWNEDTRLITMLNRSNTVLQATFSWEQNTALSDKTVYPKFAEDAGIPTADLSLILSSVNNTGSEGLGSKNVNVSMNGDGIEEDIKLGTITISFTIPY